MREPRTGSSWVTNALLQKLDKKLFHYEFHYEICMSPKVEFNSSLPELHDYNKLYSTHLFHVLPKLKDIDPYVIRTARRNKMEQCLSMLYWNYFPNSMRHYFIDESRNTEMNSFVNSLNNPVVVNKEDVIDLLIKIRKRDELWRTNLEHFSNSDVVVYEDLFDEVYLSKLDIKLSFSEDINFSHKMPEYKTKAFKNYDQIVEWCDEIIPKLNFIQY